MNLQEGLTLRKYLTSEKEHLNNKTYNYSKLLISGCIKIVDIKLLHYIWSYNNFILLKTNSL